MKDFTTADALGILSDTLERVQRKHKHNIVSKYNFTKEDKNVPDFKFQRNKAQFELNREGRN